MNLFEQPDYIEIIKIWITDNNARRNISNFNTREWLDPKEYNYIKKIELYKLLYLEGIHKEDKDEVFYEHSILAIVYKNYDMFKWLCDNSKITQEDFDSIEDFIKNRYPGDEYLTTLTESFSRMTR